MSWFGSWLVQNKAWSDGENHQWPLWAPLCTHTHQWPLWAPFCTHAHICTQTTDAHAQKTQKNDLFSKRYVTYKNYRSSALWLRPSKLKIECMRCHVNQKHGGMSRERWDWVKSVGTCAGVCQGWVRRAIDDTKRSQQPWQDKFLTKYQYNDWRSGVKSTPWSCRELEFHSQHPPQRIFCPLLVPTGTACSIHNHTQANY